MRLGKASIPPRTKLEDGEAIEHQFPCPFTRLTLTDRRIIFSTFLLGDTAIPYGEVTGVLAGFSAGPVDMRDNSSVVYGIYVCYGGEGRKRREEWAWIPRPKIAAEIISSRSRLRTDRRLRTSDSAQEARSLARCELPPRLLEPLARDIR